MVFTPNYCDCDFRVTGSKKDLQEFKKLAEKPNRYKEENVLNTNNFIQYPKKFDKLDKVSNNWMDKANKFAKKNEADNWYCGDKLSKKLRDQFVKENGEQPSDGYNKGGYEWCINNWGTKWGICHPELVNECDEELEYEFQSAWSPPMPVILKMSKMFPTLSFQLTYFECGVGFNGLYICKAGKEIENQEGNYFGNRGG